MTNHFYKPVVPATLTLFLSVFLFVPHLTYAASSSTPPTRISLPVPFYWEIPDGVWVRPWSGACEEASVVATEGFYLGYKKQVVPKALAKQRMLLLFAIENKWLGHDSDTNASDTAWLINNYTSFDATIVDSPTLEQIKVELAAGHPVISMHYGLDLNNPRHRFRRGGSSYHVMTITGFDDATSEFLVNDSELADGIDFRYTYATILSTLHDFDYTTKTATGPARVLFTKPKTIVKVPSSNHIFLVQNGIKHYIINPTVFINHRWNWKLVKTVDQKQFDAWEMGSTLEE